jgi:hypothetical protein
MPKEVKTFKIGYTVYFEREVEARDSYYAHQKAHFQADRVGPHVLAAAGTQARLVMVQVLGEVEGATPRKEKLNGTRDRGWPHTAQEART